MYEPVRLTFPVLEVLPLGRGKILELIDRLVEWGEHLGLETLFGESPGRVPSSKDRIRSSCLTERQGASAENKRGCAPRNATKREEGRRARGTGLTRTVESSPRRYIVDLPPNGEHDFALLLAVVPGAVVAAQLLGAPGAPNGRWRVAFGAPIVLGRLCGEGGGGGEVGGGGDEGGEEVEREDDEDDVEGIGEVRLAEQVDHRRRKRHTIEE